MVTAPPPSQSCLHPHTLLSQPSSAAPGHLTRRILELLHGPTSSRHPNLQKFTKERPSEPARPSGLESSFLRPRLFCLGAVHSKSRSVSSQLKTSTFSLKCLFKSHTARKALGAPVLDATTPSGANCLRRFNAACSWTLPGRT